MQKGSIFSKTAYFSSQSVLLKGSFFGEALYSCQYVERTHYSRQLHLQKRSFCSDSSLKGVISHFIGVCKWEGTSLERFITRDNKECLYFTHVIGIIGCKR